MSTMESTAPNFVKMHPLGGQAVDFALRHRQTVKNCRRFSLDPFRKPAFRDQPPDFGISAAVLVFISGFMSGFMLVRVVRLQMHLELRPFDLAAFGARGVQMVALQAQLRQLAPQVVQSHPQVQHRADKHVAADAAENIQVNRFHLKARPPPGR